MILLFCQNESHFSDCLRACFVTIFSFVFVYELNIWQGSLNSFSHLAIISTHIANLVNIVYPVQFD